MCLTRCEGVAVCGKVVLAEKSAKASERPRKGSARHIHPPSPAVKAKERAVQKPVKGQGKAVIKAVDGQGTAVIKAVKAAPVLRHPHDADLRASGRAHRPTLAELRRPRGLPAAVAGQGKELQWKAMNVERHACAQIGRHSVIPYLRTAKKGGALAAKEAAKTQCKRRCLRREGSRGDTMQRRCLRRGSSESTQGNLVAKAVEHTRSRQCLSHGGS